MALIEWNDKYSVKIKGIDEEHKQLIKLINDLHSAMLERKAKEVLGNILNGLMDYVSVHFTKEEGYFAEYKYPDALNHKKEHQNFVNTVTDFKTKFDQGSLTLTLEVMNFLKDWLIKHIDGTDKKYSAFFNEKGLK